MQVKIITVCPENTGPIPKYLVRNREGRFFTTFFKSLGDRRRFHRGEEVGAAKGDLLLATSEQIVTCLTRSCLKFNFSVELLPTVESSFEMGSVLVEIEFTAPFSAEFDIFRYSDGTLCKVRKRDLSDSWLCVDRRGGTVLMKSQAVYPVNEDEREFIENRKNSRPDDEPDAQLAGADAGQS